MAGIVRFINPLAVSDREGCPSVLPPAALSEVGEHHLLLSEGGTRKIRQVASGSDASAEPTRQTGEGRAER